MPAGDKKGTATLATVRLNLELHFTSPLSARVSVSCSPSISLPVTCFLWIQACRQLFKATSTAFGHPTCDGRAELVYEINDAQNYRTIGAAGRKSSATQRTCCCGVCRRECPRVRELGPREGMGGQIERRAKNVGVPRAVDVPTDRVDEVLAARRMSSFHGGERSNALLLSAWQSSERASERSSDGELGHRLLSNARCRRGRASSLAGDEPCAGR